MLSNFRNIWEISYLDYVAVFAPEQSHLDGKNEFWLAATLILQILYYF